MLPPFKIRNLRHSSSSPPSTRASSACSREPLVRISAPEYDQTVSRHPDATLKYIDDDDCDVITVNIDYLIRASCILVDSNPGRDLA